MEIFYIQYVTQTPVWSELLPSHNSRHAPIATAMRGHAENPQT